MPRTYRVLVTGSRRYRDKARLERALWSLFTEHVTNGPYDAMVIVHGDCETGADRLAKAFALRAKAAGQPIDHEPHEAKWKECRPGCPPGHRKIHPIRGDHCPLAGFNRNADMVALGADKCVPFYRKGAENKGTAHCARLAKCAGIDTVPAHVLAA